jgi:hypothetical protein
VIGAVVGGVAATWMGIDGLVVATAALLAVGLLALLNLRAQEGQLLNAPADGAEHASLAETIRDTLSTG